MYEVTLWLKEKEVCNFRSDSDKLEEIRKNPAYQDYIEAYVQYIDCEESSEKAARPHVIGIRVNRRYYMVIAEEEARYMEDNV